MNTVNAMLQNHPAMGVRVLEKPFVLVVKSVQGTTVVHQNRHIQMNTSIGAPVLGENISIDAIFDVEIATHRHVLAMVISRHDANGKIVDQKYEIIGEKGPQDKYFTAFYAYEAEGGNAVYTINIIEEPNNKPLFSAAVRYGKNSEKLLKAQMRMFLALAGLNGEDREKIVTEGGLLPPPVNPAIEGRDNNG